MFTQKILFPVDLQEIEFSSPKLKKVEKLARQYNGELILISVIPGFSMPLVSGYFPADARKQALNAAHKHLETFAKDHLQDDTQFSLRVREGRPHQEILTVAKAEEVGLICVPSHDRRGLDGALLGSVAQRIAERASCSVLVIR